MLGNGQHHSEKRLNVNDQWSGDLAKALTGHDGTFTGGKKSFLIPTQTFIEGTRTFTIPGKTFTDWKKAFTTPNKTFTDGKKTFTIPNKTFRV